MFTAEGLRRMWAEDWRADALQPVRDSLTSNDVDGDGNPTLEGFARIAGQLNTLAGYHDEHTEAIRYAVAHTLSTLVRQVTDAREMLASDEGKSAPGAIRKGLANVTADQERTYARLVRTFATLPESIRPNMQDQRLNLPPKEANDSDQR